MMQRNGAPSHACARSCIARMCPVRIVAHHSVLLPLLHQLVSYDLGQQGSKCPACVLLSHMHAFDQ
eukprot:1160624-Pelagomonas_calceolata.AAC.13